MLSRILLVFLLVLVILVGIGWLGFRVPASAFALGDLPSADTPPTSRPLPPGLPVPVERFARAVYGSTLPSAQTAVVSGRAEVTMNGITMPARFRFYYDMTRGHYHDIQVTWFSIPALRISERFLDGAAIIDIPLVGRTEDDTYTNAASKQGFWAELLAWVPTLALSDPRVQWESIDDNSARMLLPDAPREEAFTLVFNPTTGYLESLTTQRFQGSDGVRHRWEPRALEWRTLGGTPTMTRSSISWDSAAPWVVWDVENVALGASVAARLAQFGGEAAPGL